MNAGTLQEAHGYALLGMHLEAWEIVEGLPPAERMTAAAVAVRLIVCTGLRKWEMGAELARLVLPGSDLEHREATGRFHLARGEWLAGSGDIAGARAAVAAMAAVWSRRPGTRSG